MTTVELHFDKGSLLLKGISPSLKAHLRGIQWDQRVRLYRAPANRYRDLVLTLRECQIPYTDHARAFQPLPLAFKQPIEPRPFQQEAMTAWLKAGREGVVVLPTGAGKTILAVMLIARVGRPTLIHVPTIDLMHQWHAVLLDISDSCC